MCHRPLWVVLREVARGIREVPEEVRAVVVATQTPHVPLGVVLQHRRGAAADLDEIIDDPLWKPDTVEGAHRRPLGRVPLEVL
jgi:hypothetical protein